MKKKHVVLIGILAAIIILAVVGIVAMKSYMDGFGDRISALTVTDIDLSTVPDGTWKGSCSMFPVTVEVSVEVREHRIEMIKLLKHTNGQGSAAEVLPGKVVDAQSLDVDTIAGATASSKVILKAIEDALSSR